MEFLCYMRGGMVNAAICSLCYGKMTSLFKEINGIPATRAACRLANEMKSDGGK